MRLPKIINLWKNKSSKGHGGISLTVLKYVSPALTFPITIFLNNSLQEGFFPDALRKLRLLPIHKSKDKEQLYNYRPISVVPSLSKVFEKNFKQLYIILKAQSAIYESQYGFRSNHSTIDAIIEFTNKVAKSIEN